MCVSVILYLVDTVLASFCPIAFKLHMQVVDDKRKNSIDFGSRGQGHLWCIKPCGHDNDYNFSQIAFKLYVEDERRNPIDFESKVKVTFCTLYIKPCGHENLLPHLGRDRGAPLVTTTRVKYHIARQNIIELFWRNRAKFEVWTWPLTYWHQNQ